MLYSLCNQWTLCEITLQSESLLYFLSAYSTSPSYYEVIKNPIDLSTMGAKLEEGMYKDRFAFEADFRLMIANAKQYNPAETYAHTETIRLEKYFEQRKLLHNTFLSLLKYPQSGFAFTRPSRPRTKLRNPVHQPNPLRSNNLLRSPSWRGRCQLHLNRLQHDPSSS